MQSWQRRTRLLIAVFAVAFAVVLAFAFRRGGAPGTAVAPVVRTDPGAIVESSGGRVERFRLSREDVRVEYDKQLTYADGSSKLIGVRIITDDRGGRSVTVTGKEGRTAGKESSIALDGDVHLTSSDGMDVRTEHATYSNTDSIVRAPGPVAFSKGRLSSTGVGMTYDTQQEILSVLDQAVVHIAKDDKGAGAAEIAAGGAVFARRDKTVLFERGMKMDRDGQIIEAATATARLTADEKHLDIVDLRDHARITVAQAAVGGLQSLTGDAMTLRYRPDESLEHALITGNALIELAGENKAPGRQITASTIDLAIAPDGATPTALAGRDDVQLTLPAEAGAPARTIRSTTMDATGEPRRGLTRAQFAGNVRFREQGGAVDRGVTAATLDVALKPGMSGIEDARFARGVRLVDGKLTAQAAAVRYDLAQAALELTGSEPGTLAARVVTDQIAVDGTRIDVTLAGPVLKATGTVKSVVQAKPQADGKSGAKMPSMLKADQPVNVTGAALDYDGTVSKATYTGGALLWQGDTSLKADTIVLDGKTGDLSASGTVTTTTTLEVADKNKKSERVRSIGTAKSFRYEDAIHRATYTESAHLSDANGDMTANKIELYLKAGDELERAEAYEDVTLRDTDRKITGVRLTYTTADERYVVSGTPVTIVDECERETRGKTLTYLRAADTIVIDGNEQARTLTKGSGKKCG